LLQEELRVLEEWAAASGTADPAELVECLARLRTHLAEHFRLEEAEGYGVTVLVRAPHRERAVQALLKEHGELSRLLEGLTRTAASARCVTDELRETLRAWIHRLRRHESQENLLFEDAFDLECCAED
jgi:hypothetical protein